MPIKGGWRFCVMAAALLTGGPAVAQEAMASDTPFTLLVDASRYYPDRAQRMEVSGWARLRCVAHEDATLGDCIVVGEGPAEFGFGKSVLMLARSARVRPEVLSGVVGRPSYYKITFQAPGSRRIGLDPVKSPKRKVIEAARPPGADAIGMAGLSCLAPLATNAPLTDCVVEQEGPAGQGFGEAAIALAQTGYSAAIEPVPEKVEIWFGADSLEGKDARGVVTAYGSAGTDLIVSPTASVEAVAGLPRASVKMTCGWTADGQLRDCVADSAATAPAEAVAAVLAFTPNLRVTRKVGFNINWGQ
jgi:hypothetical protein